MKSLKQFFSYMNDINFPYVVLRNFENLPNDFKLGEHSDLDLLVMDYDHFFEIFPQAEQVHGLPRVRTRIKIADSVLYADIRHVGDNYYPEDFERSILRCKEWNERGFFTPDYTHHIVALAYHAVHHKNRIAPEYKRYLGDATVEGLLESLQQSNTGWTSPKDKTVGSFHGYWKGATSTVEKQDGWVTKKQNGYSKYPLIENEVDILSKIGESKHFPKHRVLDGDFQIEDCGEHLTAENTPEDWDNQLNEILSDLKGVGISHRDIKQDNLMVKDGVLKLIDFGWSIPFEKRGGKFEELENEPPTCLGFPNRPSSGFDDEFSMNRVRKQIDYMIEEGSVKA